ncbi:MJ0042-type zinc finger domain-containing protein [Magnetococcales bacterium HHB-1]
MREPLTCPHCSVQFIVPSSIPLPKGRKVKCGQCQHVWDLLEACPVVSATDGCFALLSSASPLFTQQQIITLAFTPETLKKSLAADAESWHKIETPHGQGWAVWFQGEEYRILPLPIHT